MRTPLFFMAVFCALCIPACAQVDVSASVFAQYGPNPSGNGASFNSGWNPGAQVALRDYRRPWAGWEVSYSFNPEGFSTNGSSGTTDRDNHTVLADYVVNAHILNVRAFLLGGLGDNYVTQSNTGIPGANGFVMEAGGGLDFGIAPHVGFRAQYRELFTRTDIGSSGGAITASYTPEYRPTAGIYVQF